MTRKARLAFYRRSLALWRRRHRYRQRKADFYHLKNNRAGVDKWYRLMKAAGVMVRKRQAQIRALTPKPKPSARGKVVAKARSYLGVYETSYNGGGIITVWQRRLGFNRAPWCGIFCGNMLLHGGIRVSPAIASVAQIEEMAKRRQAPFRGWTLDEKQAFPGDLVVIGSYGQHVGMVERVNPDGSLTTIEGNCGNAVRRMYRSRAVVRGIAQVNF